MYVLVWFTPCSVPALERMFIVCLVGFFTSKSTLSHIGMGLPGKNQYQAADKMFCSRTQLSDYVGGEAPSSNPAIPSLTNVCLKEPFSNSCFKATESMH